MKQLTILFLIYSLNIQAQVRILTDGEFDDWKTYPIAHTDLLGDDGSSDIDFGKLKMANDQDHLLLFLEMGRQINLQDLNDVTLYVDIDNNASSGLPINGIGAELEYTFGDRSGVFHSSSITTIRHRDIGLITAPTVTSDRFEIALKRVFTINDNSYVMNSTVKAVIKDNSSNGDILPDDGSVIYTFSNEETGPLPLYSMAKPLGSDIRIMSYNVERDGLFEMNRANAYKRIFKATQPDIIGFQEIYDNSSEQVANKVESMLPSASEEQWHHAQAQPDCHAISRYPVLKSAKIEGANGSGNGAFLIDIPDVEAHMLLIVAHPPCCSNNDGRQEEVDRIMQFIRIAKEGNGPIPLEENAPIVIVGDMNFVGDEEQLQTLLAGDIADESSFGGDFNPDWDGSNFVDSKPFSTGVPFNYTWYSESSAFSPGRLDYILYSGSGMTLDNGFSLFTPGLTSDSLSKYQLSSNDAVIASDHLPIVADFSLKNKKPNVVALQSNIHKLEIVPNPSVGVTRISFTTLASKNISIELIDQHGKSVLVYNHTKLPLGNHSTSLNTSTYATGVYTVKFTNGTLSTYKKIVIMR